MSVNANVNTVPAQIEEALPAVEVVETSPKAAIGKHVALVTVTVSLMLIFLGFTQTTTMNSGSSTGFRSLLELTLQGERMPVPFWINRQDVDKNPYLVQNAFYAFYYLKGKTASLEVGSDTLSVKFFDSITKTDSQGKVTTYGYFNPLTPNGLPSNTFMFEYGDVCEATKDYREGQVELECGPSLAVTSISEITPCRYRIIATTPERCSATELHSFLGSSSLEASAGFWNFKVNFGGSKHSHVVQYHKDSDIHERVLLGHIDKQVDENKNIKFVNGDLCASGKHREGTIKVECGCQYEMTKLVEAKECVYEMAIAHPDACTTPLNCDKKQSLRKTSLDKVVTSESFDHAPTDKELGNYPRDLLNPRV